MLNFLFFQIKLQNEIDKKNCIKQKFFNFNNMNI